MPEATYSPGAMLIAAAEIVRAESTADQIGRRDIEAAKTLIRKEAQRREIDVLDAVGSVMVRFAEMYTEECVAAPKRTFAEEFDYQVANDVCGGHICLNPNCFCDEVEEEPVN
jgi:hypothetical protein